MCSDAGRYAGHRIIPPRPHSCLWSRCLIIHRSVLIESLNDHTRSVTVNNWMTINQGQDRVLRDHLRSFPALGPTKVMERIKLHDLNWVSLVREFLKHLEHGQTRDLGNYLERRVLNNPSSFRIARRLSIPQNWVNLWGLRNRLPPVMSRTLPWSKWSRKYAILNCCKHLKITVAHPIRQHWTRAAAADEDKKSWKSSSPSFAYLITAHWFFRWISFRIRC